MVLTRKEMKSIKILHGLISKIFCFKCKEMKSIIVFDKEDMILAWKNIIIKIKKKVFFFYIIKPPIFEID